VIGIVMFMQDFAATKDENARSKDVWNSIVDLRQGTMYKKQSAKVVSF